MPVADLKKEHTLARKNKKEKKKEKKIPGPVLILAGIFIIAGGGGSAAAVKGHHPHSVRTVTVTVAVDASERTWVNSLLTGLGDPHTAANFNSVTAWISHEVIGWPPQDRDNHGRLVVANNPMNTTLREPGSVSLAGNCCGVQIYPDLNVGLTATIVTLDNGNYPHILADLKDGGGLSSRSSRDLLTWSGGAYSGV